MIKCCVEPTHLFNKIKQMQYRFIVHVMRGEEMENLVTAGKIQGKTDRGRQREKILMAFVDGWV
jgi:hypothetical protein